jgi:outer membrane protein assembly factor BamD (BamD/ComL family)
VDADRYNYADIEEEKKKLEAFIKKYPKSNKLKKAKARIKEIDAALKNGDSPILD